MLLSCFVPGFFAVPDRDGRGGRNSCTVASRSISSGATKLRKSFFIPYLSEFRRWFCSFNISQFNVPSSPTSRTSPSSGATALRLECGAIRHHRRRESTTICSFADQTCQSRDVMRIDPTYKSYSRRIGVQIQLRRIPTTLVFLLLAFCSYVSV